MFLKPALAKAQDERVKEMAEFRAKQLHQKSAFIFLWGVHPIVRRIPKVQFRGDVL
jgi:hypothetical protein